jgi:hypothetical protein
MDADHDFIFSVRYLPHMPDGSDNIETGYGLDSRLPARAKYFSTPQRPDRSLDPPSLLHNGYRWIKSWAHEADHTPPSSAQVVELYLCALICSLLRLN